MSNGALQALPSLASSDEHLLWIIAYVHCKDGVSLAGNAITTNELNTVNTSCGEWCECAQHGSMKEIYQCPLMGGFVCDVKKVQCWEICKQDLTMT